MTKQHSEYRSLVKAAVVAVILSGPWSYGAEAGGDRVVVPLSDPSRPAMVRAHLLNGSITVKGYDGKDVIVETRGHSRETPEPPENSRGLHRIPQNSGLSVDSENNEVNIKASVFHQDGDFTITVPHRTSLSLSTVNNGNITISDVDGELDINNINGNVTLHQVSGSVVAHALNGRVLAVFNRVDPQKPMAFSSMNGDIDVTLPPDTKANLNLHTDNGEIYSDFDIQVQPNPPQSVEEDEEHGHTHRHRVRIDKTLRATLNGGGPEIQFKDFNGNIYLRKSK